MVVVQINYRRPDMPKAEWEARYTDERAAQFLSVPGLHWKIWLDGEAERLAGGLYLFEDRAAAEAYVNGPIVARLKANPELSEVQIRVFEVRERMSAITRAPLPHLRAAAE
ncbi:YdhR family protein [Crenalkalicoccus roseus]|uniref:YdhR family protein n=1 Tax=Crenalkalicoccus roseus TaxID=1485588 RepID=UPI0010818EE8|nr:YdhR family protein [Crenalkalicoccus roseus]